ncbi:Peptidase M20 [uncultured Paludibacter sp.]|nr:Peptidase M20 [uncultured Paludibacter sp.]
MYEKETSETIGLLKKIISIPSVSKEEDKIADFLENYLKEKEYAPKRIKNNIYIIGNHFDKLKKTILLNSHIDTVKPVSGWNIDPFLPEEKEGKIYGLGSNDAGASVVSLLQTFFILNKTPQPYNLIFLASTEEEISGINGMEMAIKELPLIDFAIVGEPTEMKMAIAEKGLMVLDCTAYGKAGHAARNEGENAIYKALKDIEWFKSYNFDKVSDLLGEVRMNVTQMNAGTQHNVIPDKCSFVVDIRSNELYSNEEILSIVKESISCDVIARSTRLSSTKTPDNHPILKKAEELNIEIFGSPTLSDQALMPFPSVKIGPGKSERSHTADEFIYIEEIGNAISKYVELLNKLEI